MSIQDIIDKFLSNNTYLGMGAGKLSLRWNCSKDDIYTAKEKAREILHNSEVAELSNTIAAQEDAIAKLVGEEPGIKKFHSTKPLSPQEIKDLVQADGVNTVVTRVFSKLQSNGVWLYTIETKNYVNDFYSKEELKEKLKELFPDIKAQTLPSVKKTSDKMLTILISDDHVGSVIEDSLYDQEWNKDIYRQRLLQISAEAKALDQVFEEVHVISLGDQLNGWNSQTTRGGHEVKSLSNKEQFDGYTEARMAFYNDLFTSGISKAYHVHDIENSNHSGLGFSYMANRFLGLYIESKFPDVTRKSYFKNINSFDYGIHTIGFTHGKDEKTMSRPFPLKLDPKTDLHFFQYFDNKKLSPATRRITLYKGDLHSYEVDKGKFGRYINVPAVLSSTEYIENNFGNTESGALMEVFQKDNKTVNHIPIWF